jgi:hypothetical protein
MKSTHRDRSAALIIASVPVQALMVAGVAALMLHASASSQVQQVQFGTPVPAPAVQKVDFGNGCTWKGGIAWTAGPVNGTQPAVEPVGKPGGEVTVQPMLTWTCVTMDGGGTVVVSPGGTGMPLGGQDGAGTCCVSGG